MLLIWHPLLLISQNTQSQDSEPGFPRDMKSPWKSMVLDKAGKVLEFWKSLKNSLICEGPWKSPWICSSSDQINDKLIDKLNYSPDGATFYTQFELSFNCCMLLASNFKKWYKSIYFNKRKLALEEVKYLTAKKSRLKKDIEALYICRYAMQAEEKSNLTRIAKSNSMRKSSKDKKSELSTVQKLLDVKQQELLNM